MAAERPRVLFLGPDEPGGMRTAIDALLNSPLIDRYRIEVVVTHRGSGAARRLTVFAAALARLAWWSLRGRGRIVHIHATKRGSAFRKAICVLLAKALRRRVVLHMHAGPGDIATFGAGLGSAKRGFLQLAFRKADRVLSVSRASATALSGEFACGDIAVLPNPAPEPPPGAGRMVADPDPVALYLGGFANPVKGGEVLLEALAGADFDEARLVLAGPGSPPARLAELLAARPRLQWRGWLEPPAKEELLMESAIFVLPSTSEGLPMALLEAMSHGLAIVCTAVGGVPDTVVDGADALLVEPGDAEALSAAIARLRADAELRRRLGTAALAKAEAMGPRRTAGELDAIYRSLLAEA
jgi:glycosyltransferase involved in cell wall biosynthesis